MSHFFRCLFALSLLANFFSPPVSAEQSALAVLANPQAHFSFERPRGFAARIEFWQQIFAKYGKHQHVLHHRLIPAIIYAVVDVSPYQNQYSEVQLERLAEREIEQQSKIIKSALLKLATGDSPTNEFEQRIQSLFRLHARASRDAYTEAATDELIRSQRGIKERFAQGLVRSGRYLYAIEGIFAAEGLPVGLARLPLIESSFDYTAYSSVGAAGIWQFMRGTAKKYMRVDASIDERRDAIIASRAAASYLKHAYNQLGTWPLAITSYNHGITGVKRGAKAAGSRDLGAIIFLYKSASFGFASSNFYAEFLAALEIEQNIERYFPGLQREKPWYFDEVRLGKSLRFGDLAQLVGVSREHLAEINLSFRPPVTTGRSLIPAGTIVKLPTGTAGKLLQVVRGSVKVATPRLARAAEERGSQEVTKDEEVGRVAEASEAVATVVPEVASDPVKENQVPPSRTSKNSSAKAKSPGRKTYTVAKGDTLYSIARKNGFSLKKLQAANPKVGLKIRPGDKIVLP